MDIEQGVKWIVDNWEKIPQEDKIDLRDRYGDTQNNIPNVADEDHVVVLLIDRQKPSVERSWDFDEERIGVTKTGKIIWGFDSGCSCPSPWHDSYPDCYSCSESWKQFEINISSFDEGAIKESLERIEAIKEKVHG